MSATAAMISQVRQQANEPVASSLYSDETIRELIERYPLIDSDGYDPDDDNWTATYDTSAATADLWQIKAGALADTVDMSADGISASLSQRHGQHVLQARFWRSRSAVRGVTIRAGLSRADIAIGETVTMDDLD